MGFLMQLRVLSIAEDRGKRSKRNVARQPGREGAVWLFLPEAWGRWCFSASGNVSARGQSRGRPALLEPEVAGDNRAQSLSQWAQAWYFFRNGALHSTCCEPFAASERATVETETFQMFSFFFFFFLPNSRLTAYRYFSCLAQDLQCQIRSAITSVDFESCRNGLLSFGRFENSLVY